MTPAPITGFLAADGFDGSGRRFDDVLAFDDDALERHHDFIQWLFPLDAPSRAVPGSPVLDATSSAAIRASSVAQERLARAVARMLRFYEATSAWRRRFDHNHLRITRIIKSLRLLVGDVAADDFRRAIVALSADAPVDAQARRFWAEA